jgi:hypothetical protein
MPRALAHEYSAEQKLDARHARHQRRLSRFEHQASTQWAFAGARLWMVTEQVCQTLDDVDALISIKLVKDALPLFKSS